MTVCLTTCWHWSKEAQQSVYFMAYSFTSDELAEALLGARRGWRRGAWACSKPTSTAPTSAPSLTACWRAGCLYAWMATPDHMHHKVLIIDEHIVITGSYNFTANAEQRNDENLLVIDDPALAHLYLAEFQRVFDLAAP